MWTFRKETFCMAIFGSRETGAWQESSKYIQEMHGAASGPGTGGCCTGKWMVLFNP